MATQKRRTRLAPRTGAPTPIDDSAEAPRRAPATRRRATPPEPEPEPELEAGEIAEPEMGGDLEESEATLFEQTPPKSRPRPQPPPKPKANRITGDPSAGVISTANDFDRLFAAREEVLDLLNDAISTLADMADAFPSIEAGVSLTRTREARMWVCEINGSP